MAEAISYKKAGWLRVITTPHGFNVARKEPHHAREFLPAMVGNYLIITKNLWGNLRLNPLALLLPFADAGASRDCYANGARTVERELLAGNGRMGKKF